MQVRKLFVVLHTRQRCSTKILTFKVRVLDNGRRYGSYERKKQEVDKPNTSMSEKRKSCCLLCDYQVIDIPASLLLSAIKNLSLDNSPSSAGIPPPIWLFRIAKTVDLKKCSSLVSNGTYWVNCEAFVRFCLIYLPTASIAQSQKESNR